VAIMVFLLFRSMADEVWRTQWCERTTKL